MTLEVTNRTGAHRRIPGSDDGDVVREIGAVLLVWRQFGPRRGNDGGQFPKGVIRLDSDNECSRSILYSRERDLDRK